jgi:hypothetical protein
MVYLLMLLFIEKFFVNKFRRDSSELFLSSLRVIKLLFMIFRRSYIYIIYIYILYIY